MDDSTYTLEWRGTRRSGYSYEDIEAALVTGELHSMYKIHVNGRWQVLRDYLEQYRTQYAAYGRQSQPPQPVENEALPSYNEAMAEPAQPHRAAPAPHRSAPLKPAWFWPAIILSGTACLLLALVLVYVLATGHSASQRTTISSSHSGAAASTTTAAAENKSDINSKSESIKPFSFTGKEIYPSALISTATVDWNGSKQSAEDKKSEDDTQIGKHELPVYGDENSWLSLDFAGLNKGVEVSVEITADGFMKPSKWHGTVKTLDEDGRVRISPKIMWDYEALSKVRQQRPINIIFSAIVDGTARPDINETYTLRSINDCPLCITWDKEGRDITNLKFLFAAYVNENHPQVQEILKEALACHTVPQFDGYLSENPDKVLDQIFSIWNALQRRGIKYSNVAATTPGDTVFSQTVRFLDQSINDHQANCVDGSVLMASVLQKIGIKSYLVIVPQHCFLAFDLVPDNTSLPMGLETTMLGNNDITEVKKLGYLPRQELSKEYKDSYKTFNQALESGSADILKYSRILQAKSNPHFGLISIEDSRKQGIMPIPFTMDK